MAPREWSFPRADALPTYAFLVTDEVKARTLATGAEIIDLGLGNPDRPTPKPIVDRLHEAAEIGKNHRYHPGRGYPELRQALSRWYQRRYKVSFDPDRDMIVTMGAKEGISHLCLAILDVGDTAVVPDPCYPIHRGAPLIAGADVVAYDANAHVEPAVAVAAALDKVKSAGKQAKLVIANYPQNPTGAVVTKDQLAALVRVVADSGALLLHDLAYADLDFAVRHAPSIFDCGIDPEVVRTFAVEVFSMSKSYNMPGWRIAYMVGNERMIAALAKLKTYMDYGTFIPLQAAAAWALDNGDKLADDIRDLYSRARQGAGRRPARRGLGRGRRAQRHDVRVDAPAREVEGHDVARGRDASDRARSRGGRSRQRLRRARRGLRALRADRGSAAHRRGVQAHRARARRLNGVRVSWGWELAASVLAVALAAGCSAGHTSVAGDAGSPACSNAVDARTICCSGSVAASCQNVPCVATWPADPHAFCALSYDPIARPQENLGRDCDGYNVLTWSEGDFYATYYYDAQTGALFAVVSGSLSYMGIACAGPDTFTLPTSCTDTTALDCADAGVADAGDAG